MYMNLSQHLPFRSINWKITKQFYAIQNNLPSKFRKPVFNRSEQISLLNDFSEIRVSSTAFLCDDDDDDDSFYPRCFKMPHDEFMKLKSLNKAF